MGESYRDLKEFVKVLDEQGELIRVKKPVDKDWEITTVTREVCFMAPSQPEIRPALLYENVKGFDIPVLLGAFASERRVGMSLGIFENDMDLMRKKIRQKFVDGYNYKCQPRLLDRGPCQDVVLTGDKVDIYKLPIPIWTPGKDAGPYITAGGTMSRDPETGEGNIGNYRIQVKGKNRLGVYPTKGHDLWRHWERASKMNKPLDVAVIIGTCGPVLYPQCSRVPYDELWIAGGFDRKPLEVVKCKTVDLEVPSTTQIVIEGKMPAGYMEDEGPFGEAYGVVCPRRPNPVIEVTAVTHMVNPIYDAFMSSGVPGTAGATREAFKSFYQYANLVNAGVTDVVDMYMPEAGTGAGITIISINKQYDYHPKQIMQTLWGSKDASNKLVIVTDADVNIRDWFEVYRALFQRMEPMRDVVLYQGNAYEVDPSSQLGGRLVVGKMGIDATMPYNYNMSLPDKELFEKVKSQWNEYGIKLLNKK